MNQPQAQTQLRHGRVTSPASRGSVAIDLGLLAGWQVNEMEGGKNFPALVAGPFRRRMAPTVTASRRLLTATFSVAARRMPAIV